MQKSNKIVANSKSKEKIKIAGTLYIVFLEYLHLECFGFIIRTGILGRMKKEIESRTGKLHWRESDVFLGV